LAFSIYDASIPVYVRMLTNLSAILGKAEAWAATSGVALSTLAEARLAPDMHPLTRQVQMASDAAKTGAARLAGVEAPSMPDTETTFPELQTRIARTIDFVQSVSRDQIDGAEDRIVELPLPGRTVAFSGRDFLLQFSLPNFLFHVVTAYDVLRHQGAPLGKTDFLLGAGPMPA